MNKDILMGAITTIAYSICFVLLASCIAVFVQYLITGFKNPEVAVEGLQFNESTLTITDSNINDASLIVKASNVLTEEQLANETEIASMEVKLKISDGNVIKFVDGENYVTEIIAKLDEEVKIAVMYNEEDGFPVGGTAKISAYSTNGTFMAKDMTVNVDVPIESISKVIIYNPVSNEDVTDKVEAEEIKFIKGDILQFSVETYPARAKKPYLTAEEKIAIFPNNTLVPGTVTLEENGLLTVVGDDNNTTGKINLEVKILKSYGLDESLESSYITADFSIVTAPATLDEIQINNENYDAEDDKLELWVGEKETIWLSARDTGNENIINLDIFLKPEYYTVGNDPFYINLTNLNLTALITRDDDRSTSLPLIEISDELGDDIENGADGKDKNKIWEIKVNRQLESGETLQLQFSLENQTITKVMQVTINESIPENSAITVSDVSLEIVKKTNELNVEYLDTQSMTNLVYEKDLTNFVSYTTVVDKPLTYSKFVYFVSGESTSWVNKTGSKIVNVSETGQIKYGDTNPTYSTRIQALGSGIVYVYAYLVLTNENGDAIDCNYEVIKEQEGGEENAGLVSIDKIREDRNYTENAHNYVYVAQSQLAFEVSVKEKLTELTYFTLDADNNEVMVGQSMEMATGNLNTKTVYAKANSMYALVDNWQSFELDYNIEVFTITFDKNTDMLEPTANDDGVWTSNRLPLVILAQPGSATELGKPETVVLELGEVGYSFGVNSVEVDIEQINITTENYNFFNDDNGILSINLIGQVEYITLQDNNNSNVIGVSWYDAEKVDGETKTPFSVLPTATYSVSEENVEKGYLNPSFPSSAVTASVVSDEVMQSYINGTLSWDDLSGSLDFGQDNDYVEANSDKVGNNYLYIKNMDIPNDSSIYVFYQSTQNIAENVITYFKVNLTPPVMTIIGCTPKTETSPDAYMYERKITGSSLEVPTYPTESQKEMPGGTTSNVYFLFGSSYSSNVAYGNDGLRINIVDRQNSGSGTVNQNIQYTIRMKNLENYNLADYFTVEGNGFRLKEGKTAFYNKPSGVENVDYIRLKNIYVIATAQIVMCYISDNNRTDTYYYTVERELRILWGDPNESNGYYIA